MKACLCVGDSRTAKERTFEFAWMSTLINVFKQQTNEFSRLNFLMNWMGRIDALIEVDLRNMALCNLRWELSQLTSHWASGNQICYKCNECRIVDATASFSVEARPCTGSDPACICTKFVNSRKRFTLIFRQESTCRIQLQIRGSFQCAWIFIKEIKLKKPSASIVTIKQSK